MILHGKSLKAPSLNDVLQRDIKVLSLSTPTKFKAGSTNHLMLPPRHSRFTMVQVLPQSKMRNNPEVDFIEMNEDSNLKN
jgi:hypothetical protein